MRLNLAPMPAASAISATATSRPPSETSWTAVTDPSAISARTNSPVGARRPGRPAAAARPRGRATSRSQSDWPRWPAASPIEPDASPSALKAIVAAFAQSSIRPTPPIAGRRQDGAAAAVLGLGLVVERDVARDDREVERAAGLGHALDAADELAHDLGPLRIAEVHAVGGGERAGADRAEVAPGFGDRLLAALIGVGLAIARRAIGGDGERLVACRGRGRPRRRRRAAGRCRRRPSGHIARQIQRARGEVGRGHQLEQVRRDVGAFGHVRRAAPAGVGLRPGPVVERAPRRRAGRAGCRRPSRLSI